MNQNKTTFSEDVKEEISKLVYDDKSAFTLLFSYILNDLNIILKKNSEQWTLSTQYGNNIRLIKKILKQLNLNIDFKIIIKDSKSLKNKNLYKVIFNNDINFLENIFPIFNNYKNIIKDDMQKRAFIIGGFLSGGSITYSKIKSGYHFEIRSNNSNYLETIKNILLHFNIKSNIIPYHGKSKIYFKKGEYMSDILKLLGASESMYKFEDLRIQKDFTNSLQRLTNLEVSNINKTIIASQNQQIWIRKLISDSIFDSLDNKTKIFCKVRLKNPTSSLSSISEIIKKEYNIEISRTSINHLIRKIEKKYKEIIL